MFIYTIGDIIAVAWVGLWVVLFAVLYISSWWNTRKKDNK